MQHPPELKTKFLELRARGISYGQIAEAIRVSKPTLIQWGKAMAEEIADLQAAERELVREKLLGNFEQWLGRQVHHFNRLDEEFGRRQFTYTPTESVFRMMMASRKLLDRYFFEDDKPAHRSRAAAPSAATSSSEGRAPSSPATATAAIPLPRGEGTGEGQTGSPEVALPGAVETQSLGENENSKPPADIARMEMQNQTFSGPFLDQKHGGSSARVETQNPTFYPPFIHQKEGGSASDPLNHNRPEGRAVCPHSAGSQSEILNPKSEIESAFAPSRPFESSAVTAHADKSSPESASAEAQNPAKTQPFTSQNSEVHNPALSADQSKIENPKSRIAEPSDAEADFGGESLPVSPYEPTRDWLERQGINVSKIPEGARFITAG
jgi:hypothetical protein